MNVPQPNSICLSLAKRGDWERGKRPWNQISPGPDHWIGTLLGTSGHLELGCAVSLLNINNFKEHQHQARPLRQGTKKIIPQSCLDTDKNINVVPTTKMIKHHPSRMTRDNWFVFPGHSFSVTSWYTPPLSDAAIVSFSHLLEHRMLLATTESSTCWRCCEAKWDGLCANPWKMERRSRRSVAIAPFM